VAVLALGDLLVAVVTIVAANLAMFARCRTPLGVDISVASGAGLQLDIATHGNYQGLVDIVTCGAGRELLGFKVWFMAFST